MFVSIACRGLARGSAQTFLLCTTQPKRRLFTLVKDYVIRGVLSLITAWGAVSASVVGLGLEDDGPK